MLSQTDPLGQKTSYEYDAHGNVIKETIDFTSITDASIKAVTKPDGVTAVNQVVQTWT